MESLARIAADGGEGTLVVAQIEAVVSAERFADLPGERTSDDDVSDDAPAGAADDAELVDDATDATDATEAPGVPADPNSPTESADSGPVPPRPFG